MKPSSKAKVLTFGGTIPVHSHKSCVVYDSKTGRIHRVHHRITLQGGREKNEQEVGAEAIALLARRGVKGPHLKVLHVSPDTIEGGVGYAVDLKSLKLVKRRKA